MIASTDIVSLSLHFLNVDEEDVEAEVVYFAVQIGGDDDFLFILKLINVCFSATWGNSENMRGGIHDVTLEKSQDDDIVGRVEGDGCFCVGNYLSFSTACKKRMRRLNR